MVLLCFVQYQKCTNSIGTAHCIAGWCAIPLPPENARFHILFHPLILWISCQSWLLHNLDVENEDWWCCKALYYIWKCSVNIKAAHCISGWFAPPLPHKCRISPINFALGLWERCQEWYLYIWWYVHLSMTSSLYDCCDWILVVMLCSVLSLQVICRH